MKALLAIADRGVVIDPIVSAFETGKLDGTRLGEAAHRARPLGHMDRRPSAIMRHRVGRE